MLISPHYFMAIVPEREYNLVSFALFFHLSNRQKYSFSFSFVHQ
ncbi:hypothetical protein MFUM_970098 [Methylacidiphilum fumariolicum SolV]|uniref:Uncharacterized protein n=2 Tax=Candidatus Methylacidiphilum fumarolicum TaxID=591154 RepID=I0K1F8_METFB|nr:conserved protein of unknown function [Candidatus Methylacidiphilum fumarolicum]CCG93327.1 hypothetical protein MFUM_970098 [Methylacidiphilum fumariolicum SolV]